MFCVELVHETTPVVRRTTLFAAMARRMPVNAPRVALVLTLQGVWLDSVMGDQIQDHVPPFMHPFVAMETNFRVSAKLTRLDFLPTSALQGRAQHRVLPSMRLFVAMAMIFLVNASPTRLGLLPTNVHLERVRLPVLLFMLLFAATAFTSFRVNATLMVQVLHPINVITEPVLHNAPLFETRFVATVPHISINVERRSLALDLVSVPLDSVDQIVLAVETPCVV